MRFSFPEGAYLFSIGESCTPWRQEWDEEEKPEKKEEAKKKRKIDNKVAGSHEKLLCNVVDRWQKKGK